MSAARIDLFFSYDIYLKTHTIVEAVVATCSLALSGSVVAEVT
jgi:hypothetical protein